VINLSKAKSTFIQSLFFKTHDAVVSLQLFLSTSEVWLLVELQKLN